MKNIRRRLIIITTGLLLAALLPASAGAFDFPETRAGEVAKAYIESLNSGDLAKLQAFSTKYRSAASLAKRSPEERAKRSMGLHEQMGALVPAMVADETENSLTLTVRADKVGMWLSCKFDLEEAAPYGLVTVTIMPTSSPEVSADDKTPDYENLVWNDLSDLLEQIRKTTEIPALAAAIVENGKVTDIAVVGVRRAGADDAALQDDFFHVGSIGKSMTATMIGRLVELEKLDWDVTIGEILADVDMRDAYRDVTLEQLLQHRSGLPGYQLFDDAEEARLNAVAGSATDRRARFVTEVLVSEPIGPPGGAMAYSNAGYVVAGYMAERVTGQAWEELMGTHVFEPVGMGHSGFGMPATRAHPDQPHGHASEANSYVAAPLDEDYPYDAFIAPAGNIYASTGDLARYAALHVDALAGKDGVIQAATATRLHSVPADSDDGTGYAAGWMITESDYGLVHTHSGSAGTFFATVSIYPDQNCAVVVSMNIGPEGMPVSERIIETILRQKVTASR